MANGYGGFTGTVELAEFSGVARLLRPATQSAYSAPWASMSRLERIKARVKAVAQMDPPDRAAIHTAFRRIQGV